MTDTQAMKRATTIAGEWSQQMFSVISELNDWSYAGLIFDFADHNAMLLMKQHLMNEGLPIKAFREFVDGSRSACVETNRFPAFVVAKDRRYVTELLAKIFPSIDIPAPQQDCLPTVVVTGGTAALILIRPPARRIVGNAPDDPTAEDVEF